MIIRENSIFVDIPGEYVFDLDEDTYNIDEVIFFDLEHYIYKKPKCVGVFGACIYDSKYKKLHITQYMIENKSESIDILHLSKRYFMKMQEEGKKCIVTFSGNNDFSVINYLFDKFKIRYSVLENFETLDIQKEYEKEKKTSIGLKNLEKMFEIYRESEVISGSNLAKTFHKILKDKDYIERMPKEKIEVILLYNEQDVVSLYNILINWKKYIKDEKLEELDDNLEEVNESNDNVEESIKQTNENIEESKEVFDLKLSETAKEDNINEEEFIIEDNL